MIRRGMLLFAALATSVLAAGCVPVPPLEPQRSWTAPPITAEAAGVRGPSVNATLAPAQAASQPTRTPTRRPSPTVPPSPTPDPHRVVVTEEDVRRSVAAGAAAQGGAQVEGLDVRFADGKMWITARQVRYGPVSVSNLVLVGQLIAQDGMLQMAVESVQPGGLVRAVIPSLVNQALAQYTSQWYVQSVQTLDGRLELRIR